MTVESPIQLSERRTASDLTDFAERLVIDSNFDVCVVGLGYVGLPTALSFAHQGRRVLGVDTSEHRLSAIRCGDIDVLDDDRGRLEIARRLGSLELTSDVARLAEADAVVICVPTPVDHHLVPDLSTLRRACELVVSHARKDQTLILTSTSYVGTTRDLLVEPLRQRGLEPGRDVYVVFSPERIDPGNSAFLQHMVPRVVGGGDPQSAQRSKEVLSLIAPGIHVVSSAEAAEMTKLYENTFRAVNIAFALEMSQAAASLGLSVIEIVDAAATKPYGFMPFYPGPGVGGHCIPCDPHYLLWQLREQRVEVPLIEQAMATIASRPRLVAHRLRDLLGDRRIAVRGARVLIAGVAYKPGVRDTRESPAIQIIRDLLSLGAEVQVWDPVSQRLDLEDGRVLVSVEDPAAGDFDAVLVHTVHPSVDYSWLQAAPLVLDATYKLQALPNRAIV